MAEPETLLHVEELHRSFDVSLPAIERLMRGKKRATLKAVDGISFTMRRGETFALVGESGCGKSTVARLVVGLYRPTSGRVVFAGQELARLKSRKAAAPLRRRLQMIFQDPPMRVSTRAGGSSGSLPSHCVPTGSSRARRLCASGSPNYCCRCDCHRWTAINSRTNSPAVSGSGFRLLAHSPRTRNSLFAMNRLPRSTSRSRRRSSI